MKIERKALYIQRDIRNFQPKNTDICGLTIDCNKIGMQKAVKNRIDGKRSLFFREIARLTMTKG